MITNVRYGTVVVLKDFDKFIKIQNLEPEQILKVQRHLVEGLK